MRKRQLRGWAGEAHAGSSQGNTDATAVSAASLRPMASQHQNKSMAFLGRSAGRGGSWNSAGDNQANAPGAATLALVASIAGASLLLWALWLLWSRFRSHRRNGSNHLRALLLQQHDPWVTLPRSSRGASPIPSAVSSRPAPGTGPGLPTGIGTAGPTDQGGAGSRISYLVLGTDEEGGEVTPSTCEPAAESRGWFHAGGEPADVMASLLGAEELDEATLERVSQAEGSIGPLGASLARRPDPAHMPPGSGLPPTDNRSSCVADPRGVATSGPGLLGPTHHQMWGKAARGLAPEAAVPGGGALPQHRTYVVAHHGLQQVQPQLQPEPQFGGGRVPYAMEPSGPGAAGQQEEDGGEEQHGLHGLAAASRTELQGMSLSDAWGLGSSSSGAGEEHATGQGAGEDRDVVQGLPGHTVHIGGSAAERNSISLGMGHMGQGEGAASGRPMQRPAPLQLPWDNRQRQDVMRERQQQSPSLVRDLLVPLPSEGMTIPGMGEKRVHGSTWVARSLSHSSSNPASLAPTFHSQTTMSTPQLLGLGSPGGPALASPQHQAMPSRAQGPASFNGASLANQQTLPGQHRMLGQGIPRPGRPVQVGGSFSGGGASIIKRSSYTGANFSASQQQLPGLPMLAMPTAAASPSSSSLTSSGTSFQGLCRVINVTEACLAVRSGTPDTAARRAAGMGAEARGAAAAAVSAPAATTSTGTSLAAAAAEQAEEHTEGQAAREAPAAVLDMIVPPQAPVLSLEQPSAPVACGPASITTAKQASQAVPVSPPRSPPWHFTRRQQEQREHALRRSSGSYAPSLHEVFPKGHDAAWGGGGSAVAASKPLGLLDLQRKRWAAAAAGTGGAAADASDAPSPAGAASGGRQGTTAAASGSMSSNASTSMSMGGGMAAEPSLGLPFLAEPSFEASMGLAGSGTDGAEPRSGSQGSRGSRLAAPLCDSSVQLLYSNTSGEGEAAPSRAHGPVAAQPSRPRNPAPGAVAAAALTVATHTVATITTQTARQGQGEGGAGGASSAEASSSPISPSSPFFGKAQFPFGSSVGEETHAVLEAAVTAASLTMHTAYVAPGSPATWHGQGEGSRPAHVEPGAAADREVVATSHGAMPQRSPLMGRPLFMISEGPGESEGRHSRGSSRGSGAGDRAGGGSSPEPHTFAQEAPRRSRFGPAEEEDGLREAVASTSRVSSHTSSSTTTTSPAATVSSSSNEGSGRALFFSTPQVRRGLSGLLEEDPDENRPHSDLGHKHSQDAPSSHASGEGGRKGLPGVEEPAAPEDASSLFSFPPASPGRAAAGAAAGPSSAIIKTHRAAVAAADLCPMAPTCPAHPVPILSAALPRPINAPLPAAIKRSITNHSQSSSSSSQQRNSPPQMSPRTSAGQLPRSASPTAVLPPDLQEAGGDALQPAPAITVMPLQVRAMPQTQTSPKQQSPRQEQAQAQAQAAPPTAPTRAAQPPPSVPVAITGVRRSAFTSYTTSQAVFSDEALLMHRPHRPLPGSWPHLHHHLQQPHKKEGSTHGHSPPATAAVAADIEPASPPGGPGTEGGAMQAQGQAHPGHALPKRRYTSHGAYMPAQHPQHGALYNELRAGRT